MILIFCSPVLPHIRVGERVEFAPPGGVLDPRRWIAKCCHGAFRPYGAAKFHASILTRRLEFDISRFLEISKAIDALGALAQASRVKVFRLLVRQGPSGMAAGDIDVPPNTLSSHLAILTRARLVTARKEGRSVIYAMDAAGTRALLSFLVEDCCRAEPNVCDQLIQSALARCCPKDAAAECCTQG